jgi:polysaccharide export outer membrane protein
MSENMAMKFLRSMVFALTLAPLGAFAQQVPAAPQGSQGDATPSSYLIGADDQLAITVVEEPELSGTFRVDTDGAFSYPYLGRVRAQGLTLAALQNYLATRLRDGYIRNPQVRVEITQFKSQFVYVIGQVRTPGKIPMTGGSMTLLEALALAGSPTASASNEVIVVHPRRPNTSGATPTVDATTEGETIRVNRRDLELGKTGQDIVLRDGDIINVPDAQKFFVQGAVRNPGYYVLDPGMTVQQAIVLAGGLNERGSDRGITVTRLVNGRQTEVAVRLDDKVQPNDVIQIRNRFF